MSNASSPRRILHLVIEGFPAERMSELSMSPPDANDSMEIFQLTESNASEALWKIFAADTVAVWGKI
jgi:hypothetical protein